MIETSRSSLSSAEICRQQGLGPGTLLEADRRPNECITGQWPPQTPPPKRVQISAIGHKQILALDLDFPDAYQELIIDLHARDWRAVG